MKHLIQSALALLFISFTSSTKAQMILQLDTAYHEPVYCTAWDCIDKNKGRYGEIEGIFRKYTPVKAGKGAGHMFWQWEIVLSDSTSIPVSNRNKKIKYASHAGKKVVISGTIFYGIIIGTSDPNTQSATGWRIDPQKIRVKK